MRIFEIIAAYLRGIIIWVKLNLLYKKCRSPLFLRVGRNCRIRVRKDSSIIIGNKVVIGDGVKISALNGGNIYIGDNVGIGDYDQIVCHESINVDNGCNLAPQVYMFDHDHVMKSEGVVRNQFITKSISIGQNTWIGVNTTILKGSQIGKNCVVAAGSIVRGKVDNGTKYIQKRSTTMEAIPF